MTYAIDDEHSNQLTAGLSEDEAYPAAKAWATRLGRPVFLYSVDAQEQDYLRRVMPKRAP